MSRPLTPDSSPQPSPPPPVGLEGGEIQRSTLAETLATKLREQILSGRLVAGMPLPTERDIGLAFGVGRTTVREALRGLLAAGFVERRGKKLLVTDPKLVSEREIDHGAVAVKASIQEVFDTRRLLEVEGARLAAMNRTPEDLVALRGVLDRMNPADPEGYHSLDEEFHSLVMTASGNSILAQVYRATRQMFFKGPAFWRVFGQLSLADGAPPPVVGGRHSHEKIYQAIDARDPQQAARVAQEHLSRVERALVERIGRTDSRLAPAP
ncbi:FadR/GntR family transcriptional regulator [Plantactinospora mayteni]|uniref:GntR family transcriptional regulator n=1 Tax=Plantactinospora mayteni TaxID=566021 RepID=A0ABQ4ER95_9ACTN|nr:FadR/GntR family transcriptional regulator [Plantactinospora mayteni]GIG97194.1 GntR family transcriptional regulator [Plantactinospora mayteni]